MDKISVEASLGRTRYVLSDEDTNPGVVKLTRVNSDGERDLWFPKELIAFFMAEKARRKLHPFLKEALKGLMG
jgi:hypothetical protein